MDDLDPTTAASLDDLAACLRHVHLLADKPAYRALENQTAHAGGFLPGLQLRRVRLARSTLSDVLLGRKFPGKAFLLTFVEACGIDLENDRRWEQAWDRLAPQYLDQAAEAEAEQLRRQLAEARAQADRSGKEAEQLRQQLAAAEELIRQQTLAAEEMAARLEAAQARARYAHDRLAEATSAHAAELESIRAEAQAQAQIDAEREVTVVPGVRRYHDAHCILIRFMGENGLDKMTIAAARQAGCTPCRACWGDEPGGADEPAQGDQAGLPQLVGIPGLGHDRFRWSEMREGA